MRTFLRFLFTTVRGFFTILGIVVGLAAAAIVFVLVTGGPDVGEHVMLEPKDEVAPFIDVDLDPAAGTEVGAVFEAWLSPQQEGEEETDIPPGAPEQFLSTEGPQVLREDRPARGHGTLAFNREFSRAYVQLELSGLDPDEIVLAHLHCGKPGQLGPIAVDFGATGDLAEYFADGVLSYEITNADVAAASHVHGIADYGTAGCPILLAVPGDRHRTVAGLHTIATEGELYFNIHTTTHTFYGDIRGQLYEVSDTRRAELGLG